MKKMMMILLAVLLLAVGVMALAMTNDQSELTSADSVQVQESENETSTIEELDGEVIEIGEGYFVINSSIVGGVQVNFSEDSLFDGVQPEELAVGQFVQVMYDGKMTRSLPPQVFALKVGMYLVKGEVTAVMEDAITVLREEIGDEVIVFLPEGELEITVGDHVTTYTNGAMTMSLPAQTSAIGIVIE